MDPDMVQGWAWNMEGRGDRKEMGDEGRLLYIDRINK